MGASHVGLGPGLVDEHQPLGIQIKLIVEPGAPPAYDVGPVLFDGVGGLFLRVMRCRLKKRWMVPNPNG